MNRDHEVLAFRFDASTGEFLDADEIIDAKRAPLSIMSRGEQKPRKPHFPTGGVIVPFRRRATASKRSWSSSALPTPMISPSKVWGSPFPTSTGSSPMEARFAGATSTTSRTISPKRRSKNGWPTWASTPPTTPPTAFFPKRWVCRNGERCLLKGGTLLDQEPYNEVIATELFSRLLSDGDYVPYTLIEWGGAPVSSCPNFVGPTEEFIPAYYVNEVLPQVPHRDSYRHYVECCAALGVEDIETALGKMILCDDIMANTDRHWRNFGLIRDVETLEYRAAPLFDTGSSLWCRVPTRELAYTPFVVNMRPFYEDADRQLRLIGDTSWLDLDKLAGFPEWASDFLDENPSMYDRTDFIYEGLQKRIDFLHLLFG